jgi:uncharacterized protein (DUF1697 family)
MGTYVVLLRGINVGGKNKVPMAELRRCLEGLGFANVTTYIASGNVILDSGRDPADVRREIEAALPGRFQLDVELIKVLVLSCDQLQAVVDAKPAGFGEQPGVYHCDAIFLIDIDSEEAMAVFDPREGVDRVWAGRGVVYSERLSAERTKSRLGKIAGTPAYRCMTIRSWNTTVKLAELCRQRGA